MDKWKTGRSSGVNMNIGIVCEGPTEFILLKAIIDHITKENHHYYSLQPEPDEPFHTGGRGIRSFEK